MPLSDAAAREIANVLRKYLETKAVEQIVNEFSKAEETQSILLRYFNPAGAHPSALIGEMPIAEAIAIHSPKRERYSSYRRHRQFLARASRPCAARRHYQFA